MIDVVDGFMMMAERALKQRDALAAALVQIRAVCTDNADNSLAKSQQGMALSFVDDVAANALAKHMPQPAKEKDHA